MKKSALLLTALAGLTTNSVSHGSSGRQHNPLENRSSGPGYEMLVQLESKAKASFKAGDTKAAVRYSTELLQKNTDKSWWNYGNVIHSGNQILGLAALSDGNVGKAKRYLLAAGKTPGSPQLNSFGPDMVLAQKLLARGEKQAVIDYLDLVARFWATTPASLRDGKKINRTYADLYAMHRKQIADWKKQIRAGQTPKLNRSDRLR